MMVLRITSLKDVAYQGACGAIITNRHSRGLLRNYQLSCPGQKDLCLLMDIPHPTATLHSKAIILYHISCITLYKQRTRCGKANHGGRRQGRGRNSEPRFFKQSRSWSPDLSRCCSSRRERTAISTCQLRRNCAAYRQLAIRMTPSLAYLCRQPSTTRIRGIHFPPDARHCANEVCFSNTNIDSSRCVTRIGSDARPVSQMGSDGPSKSS